MFQATDVMRRFFAALVFIAIFALAPVYIAPPARAAAKPRPVAFTHVNVVPMDTERLLADQTVIVDKGAIKTIGPSATVKIPVGALRVDGRDKYLLPGLADMHTHIDRVEDFETMVAHGVTTILNLGAAEAMDA